MISKKGNIKGKYGGGESIKLKRQALRWKHYESNKKELTIKERGCVNIKALI
jgi:hypothetical protein